MARKLTFALDGTEVVQTTETTNDKDEIERSVSRLGARDVVLEHLTEQAAEAKAHLDGVTAATEGEKSVAPTGPVGKASQYHLRAGKVYCTEIDRRTDGKFTSARMRVLGARSNVLAHAVERHGELAGMQKGVSEAK